MFCSEEVWDYVVHELCHCKELPPDVQGAGGTCIALVQSAILMAERERKQDRGEA